MKTTRIITIVCWVVTVLVLTGLVAWLLLGTALGSLGQINFGFDWNTGPGEARGSYSIPSGGIDSIDINWTAGRITVLHHDGDDIQITEFSRRELRDDESFRVSSNGGTVSIEFNERIGLRAGRIGRQQSKNLEVLVPRALEILHIDSTSGRVEIDGIDASDLRINATSGRIEIFRVTAQTVDIDSTSGRIEMSNSSADRINVRSTSGRVDFFAVQARIVDTHTTSGRQYISGAFSEAINLRGISGRVEFVSTVVPSDLAINVTSGRISVTVPDEGPVSVQHSTAAGRFSSQLPVTTGVADAQFRLTTTSGRIEIFVLR